MPLQRAEEADRIEDHAAGNVRAVEAGEREEDPGEDPVAWQEAEPRVLVALADEEQHAEDQRRDEPVPQAVAVSASDRVHGELHGHAGYEQLDGVDRRQADAEDRVDLPGGLLAEDRLPFRQARAKEEVRREKRGEEEGLASDEEDDRPHPRAEA